MDNFNITNGTNFWIYVTTINLWHNLKKHFENNTEMFISTFQHSNVVNGDIIIIYVKDKNKSGFVCMTQTKSNQIENFSGKVKIFSDNNLNSYCFQIETCIFLPNLVKIKNISPYLSDIKSFKNNQNFSSKYLKCYYTFNKLDYDLGYNIIKSLFQLNPISVSFERDENDINIEKTTNNKNIKSKNNTKLKKNNTKSKNNTKLNNDTKKLKNNNPENNNLKNNDTNNFTNNGNIPIMIVLCAKSLDQLLNEPDNESNVIYDHLLNCNVCDVTDNDNVKAKLLNLWNSSNISYFEVDSTHEEYISALDSYHNLRNYNPFEQVDKPSINLLNIIEQNNIYNNCMLITSFFPKNN